MKNNLQNNTSIDEKKIDWKIVQNVMKDKFGSDIFDSWLKKIELIDEYKNYVLISVSTRFIRDWITSRYLDNVIQIIKSHNKNINRIEFKINSISKSDLDFEPLFSLFDIIAFSKLLFSQVKIVRSVSVPEFKYHHDFI